MRSWAKHIPPALSDGKSVTLTEKRWCMHAQLRIKFCWTKPRPHPGYGYLIRRFVLSLSILSVIFEICNPIASIFLWRCIASFLAVSFHSKDDAKKEAIQRHKKMEAIELHEKMASEDVVLELIGELPELKMKAHKILQEVGEEHIKNMKLYRAGELVHEGKPNLKHEKKSYKKEPQK